MARYSDTWKAGDWARWRRLRREVFNRAQWRCELCKRGGRLECDHVLPPLRGGAVWHKANLQCLCRGCHIKKGRTDRQVKLDPEVRRWRALRDSLL